MSGLNREWRLGGVGDEASGHGDERAAKVTKVTRNEVLQSDRAGGWRRIRV
ncbi:hypothetical protein [Sphingomonas lacusdianchii]|uniref:hypothetical protein n=1 Tax=Sphingomonas lacusdianchii TaxID=2917992 RepID=UPI001F5AC4F9|nr:hypothetical protein [Sphingomonas sp. JXJ CY 53]